PRPLHGAAHHPHQSAVDADPVRRAATRAAACRAGAPADRGARWRSRVPADVLERVRWPRRHRPAPRNRDVESGTRRALAPRRSGEIGCHRQRAARPPAAGRAAAVLLRSDRGLGRTTLHDRPACGGDRSSRPHHGARRGIRPLSGRARHRTRCDARSGRKLRLQLREHMDGRKPLTGRRGQAYTVAMDLTLTPEALAFQDELRTWLGTNLHRPWRDELRDPAATEDSLVELRRAWQRKLYQGGYLGMGWPPEWGGRGATEVE